MSLDSDHQTLLFRNAQLRLMLLQRDVEIAQLRRQIANWKQTAIAALAKANHLEQDN